MGGRRGIIGATLACVLLAGCEQPSTEITREHAIEIARQEISFQPDRIDAIRTFSGVTPVWRITLQGRLPGQPQGLFETWVVDIDRHSGAVVSIARS